MALLICLVGLPGSGKTTFCRRLLALLPPSSARHVSQDELKTRVKCERLAAGTLAGGGVALIDRTNVSEEQRRHWLDIAGEAGAPVDVVRFEVGLEELVRRCDAREDHPNIKPGQGRRIINMMKGKRQELSGAERERIREVRVVRDEASMEAAVGYVLDVLLPGEGGAGAGAGKKRKGGGGGEEEGDKKGDKKGRSRDDPICLD